MRHNVEPRKPSAKPARIKERHAMARHRVLLPRRVVQQRLKCLQPTCQLLVLDHDGPVALLQLVDVLCRLGQDRSLAMEVSLRAPVLGPAGEAGWRATVLTHLADFGRGLRAALLRARRVLRRVQGWYRVAQLGNLVLEIRPVLPLHVVVRDSVH